MSEAQEKRVFIYIHETVLQSWLRDAGSVSCLIAGVSVGIYFDSSALQWTGGVLAALWLFSQAYNISADARKTPQECANWLFKTWGVRPEETEPAALRQHSVGPVGGPARDRQQNPAGKD